MHLKLILKPSMCENSINVVSIESQLILLTYYIQAH